MCCRPERDFPIEVEAGKNDHPGYSFEKAPWAFVTGVGPLNFSASARYAVASHAKIIGQCNRWVKRSFLPCKTGHTIHLSGIPRDALETTFSGGRPGK